MAIGTITASAAAGKAASTPVRLIPLSFAGDGAYPAGGTVDFEGSVQDALGEDVSVLAVIPIGACGGYVPVYDKANDKLMVFEGNYDGADGPLQESSTANLSGTTFKVLVAAY
jgi:hypothetical protein